MIQIQLNISQHSDQSKWYEYHLANTSVWFDQPIPSLSPFLSQQHPPPTPPTAWKLDMHSSLETSYRGPGWIANQWREVHCQFGDQGYYLTVPGAGSFCISPGGSQVNLLSREEHAQDQVVIESALGPALILALALNGVWCLHASAAVFEDRLMLFSGESGEGKSTLARFLGMQPGWRRAGDDIIPVIHSNGCLYALPRFPQLKILPENQPSIGLDPSIKVHSIFILNKNPMESAPIRAHRLHPTTASLALTRHSVAARLFSKELLRKHLSFCAWVAQNLPVYQLDYPHALDQLGNVQAFFENG